MQRAKSASEGRIRVFPYWNGMRHNLRCSSKPKMPGTVDTWQPPAIDGTVVNESRVKLLP
jgi:hypothetical protein